MFLGLIFVLVSAYARPFIDTQGEDIVHSNKPALRVCILETCVRPLRTQQLYGTVAESFKNCLSSAFNVTVVDSFDARFPERYPFVEELNQKYDLVIIPGSFVSVMRWENWMGAMVEDVIKDANRQFWVMGVCFGHQLVAHAYGAQVVKVPGGWESGSLLFDCIDHPAFCDGQTHQTKPTIRVLSSHLEHALFTQPPPDDLKVWAWNARCPVQALSSVKHKLFTTQFHPEYSKEYFTGTAGVRGASDPDILAQVEARALDSSKVIAYLKSLMLKGG